jgi:hypothetical protein
MFLITPPGVNKSATYTWELDATVTALGCSALLLDVLISEFTTWGLDHADLVGLGVVSITQEQSELVPNHSKEPSQLHG